MKLRDAVEQLSMPGICPCTSRRDDDAIASVLELAGKVLTEYDYYKKMRDTAGRNGRLDVLAAECWYRLLFRGVED